MKVLEYVLSRTHRPFTLLLVFHGLLAALTLHFFDGTGDAGDSVQHYLYAKWAVRHPELFFDHWAKPVFVLLACPFAQFGFVGIKVFNVLVSLLTVQVTVRIAQALGLRNAVLAGILLLFSPLVFILTFSGLTEPLFALFLCLGLYGVVKGRSMPAAVVLSFLPFVRSEGLILLGVFGLYFLLKRKWKAIPLLFIGHLVYSVAGAFVHHDLLWVFTKVPYARLDSTYGQGGPFDFVEGMVHVTGVPGYALFWVGVLAILWHSARKRCNLEVQVPVFLGVLAFVVAHSLFWYLGIFNSMGLQRVTVAIAPLLSLIALIGFNGITGKLLGNRATARKVLQLLLIGYVLVFPFTANPAAIDPDKDLRLTPDQQCAIQVTNELLDRDPPDQRYILSHPYLSERLSIDPFDPRQRLELTHGNLDRLQKGDLVIWENWFAVVEQGVTREALDQRTDLVEVLQASTADLGREIQYVVYRRE